MVMAVNSRAEEVVPYRNLYTPRYSNRSLHPPLLEDHREALRTPRRILNYVDNDAFVSDMELSEAQVSAIKQTRDKARTLPSPQRSDMVIKEIELILTRTQKKRFLQFILQRYWGLAGVETALYHANIKLTTDQRRTIQHPIMRRDGGVWGGDELAGAKADGGWGEIEKVAREREKRALAMLTGDQWDRIVKVFGKPFAPASFRQTEGGKADKNRCYAGKPKAAKTVVKSN